MKKDIVERLREASGYALMDNARVTVLEAAEEIERLRNGAPSGRETVLITDAERQALKWAAIEFDGLQLGGGKTAEITAATLRGLLERLK